MKLSFLNRWKSATDLRIDYDKLREKVDLEENDGKRLIMLRLLDSTEPMIKKMEEHYLSGYEKKRIVSKINDTMDNVKTKMKEKSSHTPYAPKKK